MEIRPYFRRLAFLSVFLFSSSPSDGMDAVGSPREHAAGPRLLLYQPGEWVEGALARHLAFVTEAERKGRGFTATPSYMYLGGVNAQHGRVDLSIMYWNKALVSVRHEVNQAKGTKLAEMELIILKELAGMYAIQGDWKRVQAVHEEATTTLARHLRESGLALDAVEEAVSSVPDMLLRAYIEHRLQAIHLLDFFASPVNALEELKQVITLIRRILVELDESEAPASRQNEYSRKLIKALNMLADNLAFMEHHEGAAEATRQSRALLAPGQNDHLSLPALLRAIEVEGSAPEAVEIEHMQAQIQIQNGRHAYPFYRGNLELAVALSQSGQLTEALRLLDDIMTDAAAMNDRALSIHAMDHSIVLRLNGNLLDDLESRLIEVLLFYRTCGVKKFEPSLYRSYARYLMMTERFREAAYLLDISYKMNISMGMLNRGMGDLLLLHKAYAAMGADEQMRRVLHNIENLLLAHPETVPERLFRILLTRLDHYAYFGDADRYDEAFREAEGYIRRQSVSAAERAAFNLYAPQIASTVASEPRSPWDEALCGVDLQPVMSTTHVVEGESARGRFTLSNPFMHACHGALTIAGSVHIVEWKVDDMEHQLLLAPGAVGASMSKPLTLWPHQQIHVSLIAQVSQGDDPIIATITWANATTQSVVWTAGLAEKFRVSSVINAHFLQDSPFYSVPIIHDLYFRGQERHIQDVMVVASFPCRIELWDGISQGLLATDENGDGDFSGLGDIVYRDENQDGHPDVSMDVDNASHILQVMVFPLQATWPIAEDVLTLELYLRDAESGQWDLNAIDEIKLRGVEM